MEVELKIWVQPLYPHMGHVTVQIYQRLCQIMRSSQKASCSLRKVKTVWIKAIRPAGGAVALMN